MKEKWNKPKQNIDIKKWESCFSWLWLYVTVLQPSGQHRCSPPTSCFADIHWCISLACCYDTEMTTGHCDITADTSQPGRSWVWSDLEKALSYKTWKARKQSAVESSLVFPVWPHSRSWKYFIIVKYMSVNGRD